MSSGDGLRAVTARSRAERANAVSLFSLIDQPTTLRENKSMMTARYTQPGMVQMAVTSVTQALLGASVVKLRASRLGAIRLVCLLFVVTLKRRFTAVFSHDLRYGLLGYPLACASQFLCYAWASVSPVRRLVSRGNLAGQVDRTPRTCRRWALEPGVISGCRYTKNPAHRNDAIVVLLRPNEHKLHVFSLAKKVTAFFSISRSILSCLFSRRSR